MPEPSPVTRVVRCPRCGRSTRWEGNATRPFCSPRCKLIDLGAWADESYTIADDERGTLADPAGPGPEPNTHRH